MLANNRVERKNYSNFEESYKNHITLKTCTDAWCMQLTFSGLEKYIHIKVERKRSIEKAYMNDKAIGTKC